MDGGLWAVAFEGDVMVPMRDGVRLATDIYRPATGEGLPDRGPFPVILERTPYDKRASGIRSSITAKDPRPQSQATTARWFAARGYVVAGQDCRSRYGSEGVFAKYFGEAEDGYDTVEWHARQAWCDGKVGTMGLSYNAHTQAALDAQDIAAWFTRLPWRPGNSPISAVPEYED